MAVILLATVKDSYFELLTVVASTGVEIGIADQPIHLYQQDMVIVAEVIHDKRNLVSCVVVIGSSLVVSAPDTVASKEMLPAFVDAVDCSQVDPHSCPWSSY